MTVRRIVGGDAMINAARSGRAAVAFAIGRFIDVLPREAIASFSAISMPRDFGMPCNMRVRLTSEPRLRCFVKITEGSGNCCSGDRCANHG
ncbi:MAG TPA: hypothetical protein VFN86_01365 [Casimicrobiaceae bacterium]|nr:hypothetical protein [Casimicrobiaceae bacterium]